MSITTIIDHIGLLWTMDAGHVDNTAARAGRDAMRSVGAREQAAIAINDSGRIAEIGSAREISQLADKDTAWVDAQGGFVSPGWVDAHTHLVHAGSREHEVPARLAGAGYLEILQAGGGILSTVRATREASIAALTAQGLRSARRLLAHGVTLLEAKTGYGLTLAAEQKQLAVAQAIAKLLPLRIVHTAMPAHALAPEYRGNRHAYVQAVIDMLPLLRSEGAEFADVFVEDGVFTIEEGRAILLAAKQLGYGLKIHADEMRPIGGARLAAELGATSADHLLAATDDDLLQMAAAGVTAVCLPGTSFYLQKAPARARAMIDDAGLAVAIASDYNPGSSPSENFSLILSLALLTLHMTPEEIWTAATHNGACAIGRGGDAGVLRAGGRADFVIYDAPNPAYVLTHYGVCHVREVWISGRRVTP